MAGRRKNREQRAQSNGDPDDDGGGLVPMTPRPEGGGYRYHWLVSLTSREAKNLRVKKTTRYQLRWAQCPRVTRLNMEAMVSRKSG
jgi:hypothetical protein